MNIFEVLNDPNTFRRLLAQCLNPVWFLPAWTWALPFWLVPVLFLICRRFCRFHRADWPILSPIVRDWIASPLLLVSVMLSAALFLFAVSIVLLAVLGDVLPRAWDLLQGRAIASTTGLILGIVSGIAFIYLIIPHWERVSGTPDMLGRVPVRKREYDPRRFFKLDRGIFAGLDATGRASYIPLSTIREQHMQIVGTTGSGKGVAAQVLLPQFALAGESVFVFDPKDDQHLPETLAAFCVANKLPFHYVDLRASAPPQLNLLHRLNESDFATLLQAGFDLADNGGIDRVYRLDDRRAASNTAAILRTLPDSCLPEITAKAAADSTITEAKVFFGMLQELSALPIFATREGIRLDDCLNQAGITYVVGSTLDPITIMAQKMVLLRVLQLIYKRPKDGRQRYAALFFDEFKYLLSLPAVNALGIVRDFQCHTLIAHQSLGDLEACPGIPPAMVAGALKDNAKLKLVYQAADPDTAQWAEALSGTTRRHTESVTKQRRDGTKDHDGHWQAIESPLIHRNQLLQLPKMTGVLYGDGVARFTTMRPLREHASRPQPVTALSIAKAGGESSSSVAQALI